MLEHSFKNSLAQSHAAEDLPFWQETYQRAFPHMAAMVNHRQDGPHQRAGIDRSVILNNGKQLLIDEKVRGRNKVTGQVYTDIALEFLSDEERGVPGWVCKPLLADYIAYAIAPLGKCYLLPVIQLQAAWDKHGVDWRQEFRVIEAHNRDGSRTWTTKCVCIPVDRLYLAIGGMLRVSFRPVELHES